MENEHQHLQMFDFNLKNISNSHPLQVMDRVVKQLLVSKK